MKLESDLTLLLSSELVSQDGLQVLSEHGIRTVEDLAGQLQAEPLAVAALLGISATEADELRLRCLELLPAEVRAAMERPVPAYPLGALRPPRL